MSYRCPLCGLDNRSALEDENSFDLFRLDSVPGDGFPDELWQTVPEDPDPCGGETLPLTCGRCGLMYTPDERPYLEDDAMILSMVNILSKPLDPKVYDFIRDERRKGKLPSPVDLYLHGAGRSTRF